jgi:hybrid cluster-associated redox disulfide protein
MADKVNDTKEKLKQKIEKQEIKYVITPQTPISDIIDIYPEVVDYLVAEYDFHCMNCFLAEYETLEAGAATHGIVDEDFEEMLFEINLLINS